MTWLARPRKTRESGSASELPERCPARWLRAIGLARSLASLAPTSTCCPLVSFSKGVSPLPGVLVLYAGRLVQSSLRRPPFVVSDGLSGLFFSSSAQPSLAYLELSSAGASSSCLVSHDCLWGAAPRLETCFACPILAWSLFGYPRPQDPKTTPSRYMLEKRVPDMQG